MLLHKIHSQDVENLWSLFLIFVQEAVHKIPHVSRILLWYWLLLVLNNFENKTKKIFRAECVLQSTQLIEYTAQSPNIRCVSVRFGLADLWGHVVGRSLNS